MKEIEPGADAVSDVLEEVQVRSAVYCLSELGAPWGFRVVGRKVAKFHLVLEGAGLLVIDGREPERVLAGDLVILPRGQAHEMKDAADSPVERLDRVLELHPLDADARMRYGGDGARTRLLCGGFALDETAPAALVQLLPDVLRIDANDSRVARWVETTFTLLREEARAGEPGAKAVFVKIADLLLTQALRMYLNSALGHQRLALGGLADPRIGEVIGAIHSEPGMAWSVDELARRAGMSRTAFSGRFRQLAGETPMRYLTQVRLSRAAALLATSRRTLFDIAGASGFESDASLSKAFKRQFGVAPGAYRQEAARDALVRVA